MNVCAWAESFLGISEDLVALFEVVDFRDTLDSFEVGAIVEAVSIPQAHWVAWKVRYYHHSCYLRMVRLNALAAVI
jgi:hypothetical protein